MQKGRTKELHTPNVKLVRPNGQTRTVSNFAPSAGLCPFPAITQSPVACFKQGYK